VLDVFAPPGVEAKAVPLHVVAQPVIVDADSGLIKK
jgi:hypothetical protein